MNTIEFFRRVCPRKGSVVIVQYNNTTGAAWNREQFTYDQIEEIDLKIKEWDKNPNATIYFSVCSFEDNIEVEEDKTKIKRTQAKAAYARALAFDLDVGVGKQFETREEALIKLVEVVKELKMPKPLIMGSGIGAHIYWPTTQDIEKDLWVKGSKALHGALVAHGLEVDVSKIFDPSMVLRPAGTNHKKQEPWLPVHAIIEGHPETDFAVLYGKLKDYAPKDAPPKREKRSSMFDAVLGAEKNDLDIDAIAESCEQIRALLESGGSLDAGGNPVEEPLWRASLGIAKFTPDPISTITRLAGQHPQFDLEDNQRKLDGYKGTGPTTCAKFEEFCSAGCQGCPYRGSITSPAQLSTKTEVEVETVAPTGEVTVEKLDLPESYVLRSGAIYQQITEQDEEGNLVKDFVMVSPYEMHVKETYYNALERKSAFKLAIKYPLRGWLEEDHEADIISLNGTKFSEFLANAQLWNFKTTAQKEKLRGYLVDYLTMVQQRTATGYDYSRFGWQEDGSFVCGGIIINPPHESTSKRITGDAKNLLRDIHIKGERSEYVRALTMLKDLPGSIIAQACVVLGTTGVIAKFVGNGSSVLSIYSPETTTGKTFTLMLINSLIGHPKSLMQGSKDTGNAIYKTRGTFNNLTMVVDEMTMADPEKAADMAYAFSEGREKKTLTSNREVRDPATWDGLTVFTTNSSMLSKYDESNQSTEPLRVRTLELPLHERTMVAAKNDKGERITSVLMDIMLENYGHALPELIQNVIDAGGPEHVAKQGKAAFIRKFGDIFTPQERFYESAIISAWIMGKFGVSSGLFPFDLDSIIQYLLSQVTALREAAEANRQDAIDIIGQFMQERNSRIIEYNQAYGSEHGNVRQPAPVEADMRLHCVFDNKHSILPGSWLAINISVFRKYLKNTSYTEDTVMRELKAMGALLNPRDRVTMMKGVPGVKPGQAWCFIVNLNHPRFLNAVAGEVITKQSPITLALLDGLKETGDA